MRIDRLDLIAYGPFTGQTLDFSAGREGLHLVYGPNEAGKSSALRALRHLLYGIPTRTPDNFLHAYPDMRIGGVLRDGAGKTLSCIRRKGRGDTLMTRDESRAIPEEDLLPFLAGIDGERFEQMFGIGHAELVEGGLAMAEGEGEIGELLFAAGAGLTNLSKIRQNLDSDAAGLFKNHTGGRAAINDALRRYRELDKVRKDAQLTTPAWERLDRELRNARRDRTGAERQLLEARAERERLERIQRAAPAVGRYRQALQELEPLRDAPRLAPDARERRVNAQARLEEARDLVEKETDEIEKLEAALQSEAPDESLLDAAAELDHLQQELGSCRTAHTDKITVLLPRLEAAKRDARAVLVDIEWPEDLDAARRRLPTTHQKRRLTRLINQHGTLSTEQESARKEAADMEAEARDLERRLREVPEQPAPDVVAAAERDLEEIDELGDIEAHLKEQRGRVDKARREMESRLVDMQPWSGSLEELETAEIPSRETIGKYEDEWAAYADTLRDLERRTEGARKQRDEAADALEIARRAQGESPTENDLVHARAVRDRAWERLRARLEAGRGSDDAEDLRLAADVLRECGEESPAEDATLAEAYETALARSDDLADRLRRESDRVAERAQLESRVTAAERELTRLEEFERGNEIRYAELEARWQAVWTSDHIAEALSPREMQAWRKDYEALMERLSAYRNTQAELGLQEKEIATAREDVAGVLARLGEEPPREDESLRVLRSRARSALKRCIDGLRALEDGRRKQLENEEKTHTAARQLEACEVRLREWGEEWAEATAWLGLPRSAKTDEAATTLERLADLEKHLTAIEETADRIAGIDKRAAAFELEVRRCVGDVAPDLAEADPETAVGELRERLREANRQAERRANLRSELEKRTRRLEEQSDVVHHQQTVVDALRREAGCDSVDELGDAEERSTRRREAESALAGAEQNLLEQTGGVPVEDFLEEFSAQDPDAVAGGIERLADEIETLHGQRDECLKTITESETRLSDVQKGADASEAAAEMQGLAARIEADAGEYIALRLAASLLERGIERYRDHHEAPVLRRAGEIFSHLTAGRFEGLRAELDENGRERLVGVRAAKGETLEREGMSEGTADQLFLALRLASLEIWAQSNEPAPFIIDDVLIRFDDERSAAALGALAEFSRTMQVIFFTHHEHLIRIAEQTIGGDDVLFVHRLG